jgi:hypothetical protein
VIAYSLQKSHFISTCEHWLIDLYLNGVNAKKKKGTAKKDHEGFHGLHPEQKM